MFVFLQTTLKLYAHQISAIGSKNLNSPGEYLYNYKKFLTLNIFLFTHKCFCCSQELSDQFSPGGRRETGGLTLRHGIANLLPSAVRSSSTSASMMSPPMSPAKKNVKDTDKPKRPMNGFMLFAKKYRLELIQQHPGKDNR